MKCLRNIKLRTFSANAVDLALGHIHSPLKEVIQVEPSHSFTSTFLNNFKVPIDMSVQHDP